jgi:hypothetical protein
MGGVVDMFTASGIRPRAITIHHVAVVHHVAVCVWPSTTQVTISRLQ